MERGRLYTVAWTILIGTALFCALSVDVGAFVLPFLQNAHYSGDFTVFWNASRTPIDSIYAYPLPYDGGIEATGPYINPPSFLLFLYPFGILPFYWALVTWGLLGLTAFVAVSRHVVRPWHLAIAAISPPMFLALVSGQTTLFSSAATLFAMFVLPRRPLMAGAILGLIATVKPQAVLLAPLVLLVCNQWRALASALTAGLIVFGVSLALHGVDTWFGWLDALNRFQEIAAKPHMIGKGPTPATLAYMLGLDGLPCALLIVVGAAVGIVAAWRTFRTSEDPLLRLTALVAGSLLVTPYASPYEATPLLLLGAVMLLDRRGHPLPWLLGFLLVSQLLQPVGVLAVAIWLIHRSMGIEANLIDIK